MAPSILDTLAMPQYPTNTEIMEGLQFPDETTLKAVIDWKRAHFNKKWAAAEDEEKFAALTQLATVVAQSAGREVMVRRGEWYQCFPNRQDVMFGDKPSIISVLHEVGHLLLGASELAACQFSVALFIAAFPKQYEKLEWRGHMLVQVPQPAEEVAAL